MSYWRMIALVTLSAAALIAATTSIVVCLLAGAFEGRIERRGPASRATALFWLRVLPVAAGAVGGFGIVLPLFIWFEPRETHERVAMTLALAATAGVTLLARVVYRFVVALKATRRLSREWQGCGRRLTEFDARLPVFAINAAFPTVAVVGFHRPILFIAEQVLRDCSPDEVRAMISHECAHVDAGDNFRRLLVRACPDLSARGRSLESGWERACEEAADAAAASRAPALALPLAQALIRVARLATPSVAAPVSTFHQGGSVETRVRLLLEPAAPGTSTTLRGRLLFLLAAAAAVFVLVTAAPSIHQVMETTLAWLP
jgi:beta-lactamase regulating signal transducer with metallopeptidase domain